MSEHVAADFPGMREAAMGVLQKESELQDVVQLVGADALPALERLVLETGRLLREVFLQQNAYHAVDAYCPVATQRRLLRAIMLFHERGGAAIARGAALDKVSGIPSLVQLTRARCETERDAILDRLADSIPAELDALGA